MQPAKQRVKDDTPAKLLEAAGDLFAEVGFENATVREICRRARANVAAVNYHFGDKLGLYTEVLLARLRFAERAAQAIASEGSAEEQLRVFIGTYLRGLLGSDRPEALAKLIAAEMARPSPALKRVVRQIVRPTEARVRALVGEIVGLPPDDDTVRMCTHSIVGQCLHYKHAAAVLSILWPDLWRAPDRLERLSDHIVNFSLAALRSFRTRNKQRTNSRQRKNGRES
jgi:AcrR family transcriptional regulator